MRVSVLKALVLGGCCVGDFVVWSTVLILRKQAVGAKRHYSLHKQQWDALKVLAGLKLLVERPAGFGASFGCNFVCKLSVCPCVIEINPHMWTQALWGVKPCTVHQPTRLVENKLLWASHWKTRSCPFPPLMDFTARAIVYFWHFISLKLCCLGVSLSVPWRWVSSAFSKPPTQWQRSKLKHCDSNRELLETSLHTEKIHLQLNVFLLFCLMIYRGYLNLHQNTSIPDQMSWGSVLVGICRTFLWSWICSSYTRVEVMLARHKMRVAAGCTADCLVLGGYGSQILSANAAFRSLRDCTTIVV